MARNEEKAQSMLYRFREAQSIELGLSKPKERRPHLASLANTLDEAEKWRRDVIREISRNVSKINDASLPEAHIRDLNDDINKLLRAKNHWEDRVLQLGGPDYKKIGPKMIDHQGKQVPGNRGYKYFGRAKELPGVRELFETQSNATTKSKQNNRAELIKHADAVYFGYSDEADDGELLEYERQVTEQRILKLRSAHDATLSDDSSSNESDDSENES
ncbi:NineTeen Complex (NTC) component [Coemansia sp. RSA 376]|nr:NineTeen Complex (NTC) component [Coemansia sp. S680]KAJ2097716.1 NineTeen Complex (NTC) component [Coemansia sp. S100]KAJ2112475.1 NineTeen Complex (NTC) component [Coemansia sp. RSA 922]KAJ2263067.1 NineTeen Complex (NTC) component [Coemansia sp. RSA 376]